MGESFQEIASTLQSARVINKHLGERHAEKPPPIHNSGLAEYQETFVSLWPRGIAPHTVIVDIMGNGKVIRDLQERGNDVRRIAVELNDSRDDRAKQYDADHGNEDFIGDILDSKIWGSIKGSLGEDTLPRFIVCRGFGGLQTLPEDPRILYALLDRAYRLLRDKDILLTQTPLLPPLVSLREIGGRMRAGKIDITTQEGGSIFPRVRIIKHKDSPPRLPYVGIGG